MGEERPHVHAVPASAPRTDTGQRRSDFSVGSRGPAGAREIPLRIMEAPSPRPNIPPSLGTEGWPYRRPAPRAMHPRGYSPAELAVMGKAMGQQNESGTGTVIGAFVLGALAGGALVYFMKKV